MTTYPEQFLYSKEHEWVRVEGEEAVVGITHFAQDELGDVVFVELPKPGDTVAANDEIGTIESVKAVAEIYTPVSGEILAVNEVAETKPEILNEDPHGDGWLVRIRLSAPAELEGLMSAEEYQAFTSSGS